MLSSSSDADVQQQPALQDWAGRTQCTTDFVSAAVMAKLAAALDIDSQSLKNGAPLPLPWHWILFTPTPAAAETGPDGHLKRGGFLPPVPLPRRMWAGSHVQCHQPVLIGDRLHRESTIASVVSKSGRQGDLVFVSVVHRIHRGDKKPVLTETQDIVYRGMPTTAAPLAQKYKSELPPQWSQTIHPDPVLLFRYSALTYNGHRIHYDRNWATETEGYPGLVVHGPLIATLLLNAMYEQLGHVVIISFRFRGVAPLFDIESFSVHGAMSGSTAKLWALTQCGQLAMSLDVELDMKDGSKAGESTQ